MIVDVKQIVKEKEEELKNVIVEKKLRPKLAVILANNLESSKSYVLSKRKKSESLGIMQEEYIYDENVTQDEIIKKINELNGDKSVNGILVQLPLYPHLDENRILDSVSMEKDVDGFTSYNLGTLVNNSNKVIPCTPKGILLILDRLNVDIEGKSVVILGRSKIVGRPLAELMISKGATVTVCNSKTKNLEYYTRNADILIVAIGKAKYITSDMVKKDSIVIDVGINTENGKLVGDVDSESIKNLVKYVTPVPGGVGLTTVISLMDNLVKFTMGAQEGGILHEQN